jgi:hypothetical protein
MRVSLAVGTKSSRGTARIAAMTLGSVTWRASVCSFKGVVTLAGQSCGLLQYGSTKRRLAFQVQVHQHPNPHEGPLGETFFDAGVLAVTEGLAICRFPFFVVRRTYPLPLLPFLGIVMPLLLWIILLGMFVLRVVRTLTFLRLLVLVSVLHILPALLILRFAHLKTPCIK